MAPVMRITEKIRFVRNRIELICPSGKRIKMKIRRKSGRRGREEFLASDIGKESPAELVPLSLYSGVE